MTTLLLIRHGETEANAARILAGRTAGIGLSKTGQEQAAQLASQLSRIELAATVTSPLQRCRETVAALTEGGVVSAHAAVEERLNECDYGEWTNQPLAELAQDPLWSVVQHQPSAALFPQGEPLAAVGARAWSAISEWNARLAAERGEDAVWLVCSHEDVIKTIVASTVGVHLDLFQRIVISHGGVTAIRFTPQRPYLLCLNSTGELPHQVLAPPASVGADSTNTRHEKG